MTKNISIYLVGGAVRDHMLGRKSNDHDYVVVGATPEWMIEQGYTQVGATFPVFLHPETGAEYALARQERKNGRGHTAFEVKYDPNVSLEDDLYRRDLTINSMAMTEEGQIIDPYDGMRDLYSKVLRHTSEAFADDPLRVLRVARFAARYPDFTVAPETIELMKKIVRSGELNTLPKERIWAELYKGLKESNPIRMLQVLVECGAQHVDPLIDYIDFHFLNDASELKIFEENPNLEVLEKFLIMFPMISSIDEDKARWLRIPVDYHRAAQQIAIFDEALCNQSLIDADAVFELIQHTRYDRTQGSLDMNCVFHVLKLEEKYYEVTTKFEENFARLNKAIDAIKAIDMKAALAGCEPRSIKYRVEELKKEAVHKSLEGS